MFEWILAFPFLALASARLTSLWFEEIFRPARTGLMKLGKKVAYGVMCKLCVSVWASGAVAGLWLTGLIGQFVIMMLALSGFIIYVPSAISELFTKRTEQDISYANEIVLLRSEMTRLTDALESLQIERTS